jgi:cytochrome c556
MPRILLGSLAIALTTSVAAQFTPRDLIPPEELIQYRQAGYRFMQWNMGKIKINLDRDFNQKQVIGAANAIAAIANSGMGALYAYGTEEDVGDVKTRVKPAFFENTDDATALARDFIAKADRLAAAAQDSDQAAVRSAFGELAEACKACHKKYRED